MRERSRIIKRIMDCYTKKAKGPIANRPQMLVRGCVPPQFEDITGNACACPTVEHVAEGRVGVFVHLVYVDDSADKFQVIGAVIIPDKHFMQVEEYLAVTIDKFVPEDSRDTFEFHASAMFNGNSPFENLGHDEAVEIFRRCMTIVAGAPLAVVYGAVNLEALRDSHYASAEPKDIAFRHCIEGVEGWFKEQANGEIGIVICDQGDRAVTTKLQKAFRRYRTRLKSASHTRGKLVHLHDDMYFGDSAFSVGLQLADICSYIVLRHLQGKQDTEFLYEAIKDQISFGKIEPA